MSNRWRGQRPGFSHPSRGQSKRGPRKRIASFIAPSVLDNDEGPNGPPQWMGVRAKELEEDTTMGFNSLAPGSAPRVGWLLNMVPCTVEEPTSKRSVQAVDLFFISDDPAGDFRVSIISRPYLYLAVAAQFLREVDVALRRRYTDAIAEISTVYLEDIARPNHLAGREGFPFLKVETRTLGELFNLRQQFQDIIHRNKERTGRISAYAATSDTLHNDRPDDVDNAFATTRDPLEAIFDIREYDVAPVNRLAIDRNINVGYWYRVSPPGERTEDARAPSSSKQNSAQSLSGQLDFFDLDEEVAAAEKDPDLNASHANELFSAHLEKLPEIVERASPAVLAYDIECTKKPLKFPDAAAGDEVMMISWMLDGKGYLAINREVVSEDIEDFGYDPHSEFKGDFTVFNEPNEKTVLERFFGEVRISAPRVFATFNGDYFDWPFVETRAAMHGIDMGKEIGIRVQDGLMNTKQAKGRTAIHMDVLHWVNRDSYLPQGSRGLKAVTRALLGFEPEEIPPEEMMTAAKERPKEMARYSVSDSVCTYFLYMKYVHPFIFSLCNIIPLNPDDVLRKGSGTLCEMLLMCQAREKRIVAPNKYHGSAIGKMTDDGHVLESETYIGGHVEAIRTGVYRSDLSLEFVIDVDTIDDLIQSLDGTLHFAITEEGKTKMEDVTNYEEVKAQIIDELQALKDNPVRTEKPLIYHLDVSAMYPNIILTNRLQPHAIVTPKQCAACDFNGASHCQRDMEWTWRGEFFPASRGEAEMIQRRTAQEEWEKERKRLQDATKGAPYESENAEGGRFRNVKRQKPPSASVSEPPPIISFDNEEARKSATFRKRLKEYCRVNYRKVHQTREVRKTATVCQRENSFYVDTVRAFRDRRYEYKALLKKQKKAKNEAKEAADSEAIDRAEKLVVLYDSLQLAHKCILNSFYGYVMRRGARWYSMEMAGIVTNTGGLIIRRAREFIDKVGLSLELDTDGIWCVLPSSFPQNFSFATKSGKKCSFSYVCSVFNADVAANFTNNQYQDLADPETFEYSTRSECSILFEVDGPYKAMVLPASLEEGKSIKKRYAVFNDDGSLAELKGFEIKRRGELKLVKHFQGEIFERFLKGKTLSDCYGQVGQTCDKWLNILLTQGEGMSDDQILDLLVEQNNMSKALDEYLEAGQKSCAITCATRMKEFLGPDIVRDKGLATMYVIARKPDDSQITARAIPIQIFEFGNEVVRRKLLRKWTKCSDGDLDLKSLLDWDYYKGRLANAVLKIVSIPAALQGIDNPVPRIEYPPWLLKQVREFKDQRKQRTMASFFRVLPKGEKVNLASFRSLKDASWDTEKLKLEDIEDMPIRSWSKADIVHRRVNAVVAKSRTRKVKGDKRPVFRSMAEDPAIRELETRNAMRRLVWTSHPSIKQNYSAWLRHAKQVWRLQRAGRVRRYELKRQREGVLPYRSECDIDEKVEQKPTENLDYVTGESEPFGNLSYAARFGLSKSAIKRRRLSQASATPDYAPDHFITDLGRQVPLSTFFKAKTVPLLGPDVIWQNIGISCVTNRPGEYNLWVLPVKKIEGRLESGEFHKIPLHVKRVLYYNSKVSNVPSIPNVRSERVRGLTLPRFQEAKNLFRLELAENYFQNIHKDISGVISDAGVVDGIFGTQCPLDYEVVVTLGTLCVPSKKVVCRTTRDVVGRGVTLDELIPKPHDSVPYLKTGGGESSEPTINQAFLYGSHAVDGTSRAMYILVAPQAKIVHVIAVTPSGSLNVNVKRLYKSLQDRRTQATEGRSDDDVSAFGGFTNHERQTLPSDCQFYTSASTSRDGAWSELQTILSRLRSATSVADRSKATGMKTILLVQWPVLDTETASEALFGDRKEEKLAFSRRGLCGVEECVPITKGFPIVRIASNDSDGNYMPVGWEPQAITVGLDRFANISGWLSSQMTISRFAGIPIGNLSPTNVHAQAIDVLMGRELMNRDHVLWASEAAQPDLGGLEADDNFLQNELQPVPEVSSPGSYRTVCIDTELSNLTVATILSSSHVNQLEGTDMAFDAANSATARKYVPGAEDSEGTIGGRIAAPLDEMASSAPAFRVMKDLVTTWDKVANNESVPEVANIARSLLDHLHRWTRSESSVLYDPALAQFLGWLIRKMFRQLVVELRSLGANIVYASMSRLILATPKTKTMDGLRYAGFLEKTLKEKPLFRHIGFEPLLGVYVGLLFVDRFNYGALPAPEEQSILSGEATELVASGHGVPRGGYTSKDIPYVRTTWDMARYMPIPVAVLWTKVVEEFIRRPLIQRLQGEHQLNEREDLKTSTDAESPDSIVDGDNSRLSVQPSRKKKSLLPRGDGLVPEVKEVVMKLSSQLLEKVHEIREKAPGLSFPDVPGVLKVLNNGNRNCAVEFVRSLCHVLSHDKASTEEVATLRRNLLQLLGVREFAKEGRFVEPALPVPLHDVICTYCNAVVDLDVARDSRLWAEGDDDDETNGECEGRQRRTWACEYCGHAYNLKQIELDLLRVAQKIYTSYQVQDIVCLKCRLVKRENMMTHCSCSGAPFQLSIKREVLHNRFFALKSVAEFHKFELLDETVGWMLSSTSNPTSSLAL